VGYIFLRAACGDIALQQDIGVRIQFLKATHMFLYLSRRQGQQEYILYSSPEIVPISGNSI
jgi:hypothetical protein